MVKTTRWPLGKFLAESSPQDYFSGGREMFSSFQFFTLAAILALVNYHVTDYREQLRE